MRFNSIIDFEIDLAIDSFNMLETASNCLVANMRKINKLCVSEESYEQFYELLYMDCDLVDGKYDHANVMNTDIIKTPEITEFNRLLVALAKHDKDKAKVYNEKAKDQEYTSSRTEVTLLPSDSNEYFDKVQFHTFEELIENDSDIIEYFYTFRGWFVTTNNEIKKLLGIYKKRKGKK